MARTITDPLELDALPPWAVVEDRLGFAWVRHPGVPDRADHWVSYYGSRVSARYVVAESPLTVLHDPFAPVVPVVSDAVVEVYPFHARIDNMPDLFHVKCSQHLEFGFCGSEAEAAQARVEHLSTHEALVAPTHICTVHCEQGRGHYEVMMSAPVVPVVPEAAVEAARAAIYDPYGQNDRDRTARIVEAVLTAALPHLTTVPSAALEDLTGIINDAAFEGVEYDCAERVAAYLAARFTITPRADR